MALTSMELLEACLEAEFEVTVEDILNMLKAKTKEDLHLDWKGGALFDNPKHAARKIRESVTGFANADGGVLVLGVNGGDAGSGEEAFTLRPCPPRAGRKGKTPALAWLEQVLAPFTHYFSFMVRYLRIENEEQEEAAGEEPGLIMFVAVRRSPTLVAAVHSKFFLRQHDCTREIEPFLLADLMLGRRQQPNFRARIHGRPRKEYQAALVPHTVIKFNVVLEPNSLAWAEEVTWGYVINSAAAVEQVYAIGAIEPFLRLMPTDDFFSERSYFQGRTRLVGPLRNVLDLTVCCAMPDAWCVERELVRRQGLQGAQPVGAWQIFNVGALYVVAKNMAPQWFHLVFPPGPRRPEWEPLVVPASTPLVCQFYKNGDTVLPWVLPNEVLRALEGR